MIKSKIQNSKQKNGQAAITAVIFLLVIMLSVFSAVSGFAFKEAKAAEKNFRSRITFFSAEAGVDDAVYRLKRGKNVSSSFSISLNGSISTTTVSDVLGYKQIVSSGEFLESFRFLRSTLINGEGVAFFYGAHVGQGGLHMSNTSQINGSVFSNGVIDGANSAKITGDAVAVGVISDMTIGSSTAGTAIAPSFSNVTVHGLACPNQYCEVENSEVENFPISDFQITNWKNTAAAGGTFSGNYNLSGSQTAILGPKKITGNLTLSNNTIVILTGPLWVQGNIILSNSAVIILDVSYGSNSEVVVADGTFSTSNSANYQGSGPGSYVVLITTSSNGNAISINNSAGSLIAYAPNGTANVSNIAQLKQITANRVNMSNNSALNYESGLQNVNFVSGPSGGWTISEWKEVIQ